MEIIVKCTSWEFKKLEDKWKFIALINSPTSPYHPAFIIWEFVWLKPCCCDFICCQRKWAVPVIDMLASLCINCQSRGWTNRCHRTLATKKTGIPEPYNCSSYKNWGNTTSHNSVMMSWRGWGSFHGFGTVPQYARSIGINTSWNREAMSAGNFVLDLLDVRSIDGLTSDWSSASQVTWSNVYGSIVISMISHWTTRCCTLPCYST